MAVFTPITTPAGLPPPTGYEHLSLDFKGQGNTTDPEELAKDVAALANYLGGTLLIGVHEDKTNGTVAITKPLTDVRANEVKIAYETACADLCSPHPLISVDLIAMPQGGTVVAVNVWPFPSQIIGVRQPKDMDRWKVPARIGAHTRYLRPEQLPMLMVPEIRRIVILLEAIPPGDAVSIPQFTSNGAVFHFVGNVTGVDVYQNVVRVNGSHNLIPPLVDRVVALDLIRSVFKRSDGYWEIRLHDDAGGVR